MQLKDRVLIYIFVFLVVASITALGYRIFVLGDYEIVTEEPSSEESNIDSVSIELE